MGEIKGFLKYERQELKKATVKDRIQNWKEFAYLPAENEIANQGARCMDCGIPFCHSACPIGNIIPDWNDLVYGNRWKDAIEMLHRTNNFPEFTGRVCPAPCEYSCTLAINMPAVTIKNIELSIIERAYKAKYIFPEPPKVRTGKKVAVIGSGPAGLACADQLNKEGHLVTVFEKNEMPGGLLTFGIPEFKLEKWVVKRRLKIMEDEGVIFRTNTKVGSDILTDELIKQFDAVVLCTGAEQPRDLTVPGRDFEGIYFAIDFLAMQNRKLLGYENRLPFEISAKDKNVVVIGGGDTGSDCIGTSIRQGAKSVINLELLARPPKEREADNPWPQWAFTEKISTSHEEGCEREFAVMTKEVIGNNGKVIGLKLVRLEYGEKNPETGRRPMQEIPGSEYILDADMIVLAMGFTGPVKTGLVEQLGLELDQRGNIKTGKNYMTSVHGIFSAGDSRRGQSLVVWAINEGREAAMHINEFLKK